MKRQTHEHNYFIKSVLSCFCAGLFFFYTILQKVTFNVISNDLMSHFHLSITGLGAVSSAYLYANALWLIPGGILLERFSAKYITILFTSLCTLSSFVFAYSDSIYIDVFMRFIAGLGSAMSLLISLRLASRLFPAYSARVTGLLISFGMSAGFFANAPFLQLMKHIGWQNSMALMGCFGVGIVMLMSIFLFDTGPTKKSDRFSIVKLYDDLKETVAQKENWKTAVYIGLMNLPIFILASLWGNLYLIHTANFTMEKASFIISMIFLSEITGAPILGWISDQLQRRKLVMISGAISSLLISTILLEASDFSTSILIFLFFSLGFTLSAQVIGYTVIANNNSPRIASTASGFGSFIVNILGAICQLLFPLLLTLSNTSNIATTYKTAYLMFPAAYLLSIVFAITLKEKSYSVDSVISNAKLLFQSR